MNWAINKMQQDSHYFVSAAARVDNSLWTSSSRPVDEFIYE